MIENSCASLVYFMTVVIIQGIINQKTVTYAVFGIYPYSFRLNYTR